MPQAQEQVTPEQRSRVPSVDRTSAVCLVFAMLAACGVDDPDPCAGLAGACASLRVDSATIDRIDQLELDVVYGERHGTTATQPAGGGAVGLPIVTAIELAGDPPDRVSVVAAGKLAGVVLGTGAASGQLAGDRLALVIELAPPGDCVPRGHYCGGDKLSGDPDTLYTCNGGGVPIARGVCEGGCLVRPGLDDACRGVGGPCVEGGFYCGGDKLDGDPRSLYRCSNGVGVNRVECANGCIVSPPGTDDRCR
jgi:hypothetical protein